MEIVMPVALILLVMKKSIGVPVQMELTFAATIMDKKFFVHNGTVRVIVHRQIVVPAL